MRIEAYSQIQQVYKANAAKKPQGRPSAKTKDQLQISDFGKDMQAAKQAVAGASDIREDMTAPIKNAIAEGAYQVSGEMFADRILQKYNEMR